MTRKHDVAREIRVCDLRSEKMIHRPAPFPRIAISHRLRQVRQRVTTSRAYNKAQAEREREREREREPLLSRCQSRIEVWHQKWVAKNAV